jgi:hypothetical protein
MLNDLHKNVDLVYKSAWSNCIALLAVKGKFNVNISFELMILKGNLLLSIYEGFKYK